MSIRQGNETTKAKQAQEGWRRRIETVETRTSGVGQSTCLFHARTDCPDDRILNHKEMPLRDRLCRSIALVDWGLSTSTIEGKMAFEAYSHRHGVTIENYHADNGIFKAYKKWIDAPCKWDGHGMTFAAVNAHHQIGIAQRRIRELQDLTRAMLTHANVR